MRPPATERLTVETELHATAATVQLVSFAMAEGFDGVIDAPDHHRLIMSFTPHPPQSRVSYGTRHRGGRTDRLGDVYFFPAGYRLRATGRGGIPQALVVCELANLSARPVWGEDQLDATLDIGEPAIRWLMRRLADEARHPGTGSEGLVDAIAAQLDIELGRYLASAADRAAGGLAPWRLRAIDERLAVAYDRPPSLTELARLCDMSVRHLSRAFRISRGCSPGDYAARLRMERATELLAGGEKVGDVATALGYATTSAFTEAFRRRCGCTPGEFKRGSPVG